MAYSLKAYSHGEYKHGKVFKTLSEAVATRDYWQVVAGDMEPENDWRYEVVEYEFDDRIKKDQHRKQFKNENMSNFKFSNQPNNNAPGYRGGNFRMSGGNGAYAPAAAPKIVKHSGCSMSRYVPKEGPNKGKNQMIVNGWKKPYKSGLLVFTCRTTAKSEKKESGWMGHIACEVLNKDTMVKAFYWGTMDSRTGKVVIKDLGLVLNPKGGKGGVVAFYGKKS